MVVSHVFCIVLFMAKIRQSQEQGASVLFKLYVEAVPVLGEGACLVGADGGGVAHGLAGIEVAHQVVVAHHFL